jgi:hypothetical protein
LFPLATRSDRPKTVFSILAQTEYSAALPISKFQSRTKFHLYNYRYITMKTSFFSRPLSSQNNRGSKRHPSYGTPCRYSVFGSIADTEYSVSADADNSAKYSAETGVRSTTSYNGYLSFPSDSEI